MNSSATTLILSRLQFTLTTMFHIIWPVLTIGLSLFLVIFEILWMTTKEEVYYHHLRFWSQLLLLNFSIGVATGLVMEFEFGTNWEPFTTAAGGFFGNVLGLEGTLAFMLEAGFLGIMMFGWKRVPKGVHLFATIMVAVGGSLSAFWILVANSWMQYPSGGYFNADGVFVVQSFWKAIDNPDMPVSTAHMWVAAIETTAFVVGGISAWFIWKRRHVEAFLKTFKISLIVAIVVTPLQIFIGDTQGLRLNEFQPAKVAAIEAHWNTNRQGQGAPWNIVAWPDRQAQKNAWDLQIPNLLSILETRTLTGTVEGLKAFPRNDQPPIVIPFYAFRLMVLIGFLLFFLMLWTVILWVRGRLRPPGVADHRWLLYAWMAALPLGYLAVEMGWITREEGRQPWVIYRVLRTANAYSNLPPWAVGVSLGVLLVIYIGLAAAFIVYARRILVKGPDIPAPSGKEVS